jgi:hypothetical protein
MANNTHTYTTTVTEPLPPGRFLNIGEKILEGDLSVESDRPAEDTGYHIGETLHIKGFIYRPDPVVPKKIYDGIKCQKGYRYLDPEKIVKDGDEFENIEDIGTPKEDWWKCTSAKNVTAQSPYGFNRQLVRRKLENAKRVRKTGYRFLKEGDTVKKDDETEYALNGVYGWHKVDLSVRREVSSDQSKCQLYRRRLQ